MLDILNVAKEQGKRGRGALLFEEICKIIREKGNERLKNELKKLNKLSSSESSFKQL